ncbi:flagellar hook-length control protein FliK [Undibacterium sp. Di24W]|uniref:flagellar hook-length control protein FliK n=1 Tax=Undibacterium sp. Di24W TaxID=3413033 RepID=UPI003BF351E9
MPNTSTVSQVLPSYTATKGGQTSAELKSNSNFNQILKNEVANKVKKAPTNTTKQSTNNPATESAASQRSMVANKDVPSNENKTSTANSESDEVDNASLAISDETNNLINFVGDISAFTLPDIAKNVDNSASASPDKFDVSSDKLSLDMLEVPSDYLNTSIDNLKDGAALPPSAPKDTSIAVSSTPTNSNTKVTMLDKKPTESLAKSLKPTTDTRSVLNADSDLAVKPIASEQKQKVDLNESTNLTSGHELTDGTDADSVLANSNPRFDKISGDINKQQSNDNKVQQDVKDVVNTIPVVNSEQLSMNLKAVEPKANSAPPSVVINSSLNNTTIKTKGAEQLSNQLPEESRISLNSNERSASDQFSVDLKAQVQETRKNKLEPNRESTQNLQIIEPPRAESMPASPPIQAAVEANSISSASNFIGPKVGTKAWDQAIGQKIVWMVAGGEQSAQLTLNPPDLGPVQIVLSISDSQVDASFVSSHLDVREAIEAAAPKLREMMDNAGMSLSGFSVAAQSTPSGNAFTPDSNNRSNGNNQKQGFSTNAQDSTPIAAMNNSQSHPKGLVDTFV